MLDPSSQTGAKLGNLLPFVNHGTLSLPYRAGLSGVGGRKVPCSFETNKEEGKGRASSWP